MRTSALLVLVNEYFHFTADFKTLNKYHKNIKSFVLNATSKFRQFYYNINYIVL